MKKIFSLVLIAMLAVTVVSCDRTDDEVQVVDNDTYARIIDYNVNFIKSSTRNSLYGYTNNLPTGFLNTDVLLIYRQTGSSGVNPIWKLLPTTNFLAQGELNYYFDFTKVDFQISADADFDLLAQDSTFKNTYLNNQSFRVVLIPADRTGKNADVDLNDYDAVIKYYNINESNIKSL